MNMCILQEASLRLSIIQLSYGGDVLYPNSTVISLNSYKLNSVAGYCEYMHAWISSVWDTRTHVGMKHDMQVLTSSLCIETNRALDSDTNETHWKMEMSFSWMVGYMFKYMCCVCLHMVHATVSYSLVLERNKRKNIFTSVIKSVLLKHLGKI